MANVNDKKMKKKHVSGVMAVVLMIVGFTIYFLQGKWVPVEGGEGNYSAETYLDGGTGSYHFSERTRIRYTYIIESGCICFELTNEQGTVVYERQFRESCEGYMTFEDVEPGDYYYHEYALSDDTVAYSVQWIERKRNNFIRLLKRLNLRSGYRLFGPDFLCD